MGAAVGVAEGKPGAPQATNGLIDKIAMSRMMDNLMFIFYSLLPGIAG
jgi:hypothetical protein